MTMKTLDKLEFSRCWLSYFDKTFHKNHFGNFFFVKVNPFYQLAKYRVVLKK